MTRDKGPRIIFYILLIVDATTVAIGLICQLSERTALTGQTLITAGLPLLIITSIAYLILKKRGML